MMLCLWKILLLGVSSNSSEALSLPRTKTASVDFKSSKTLASSSKSRPVIITTEDLTPWVPSDDSKNKENYGILTYDGNDMDIFIRNEYSQWLETHGKEADESRYEQFKKNFLSQFKHDLAQGGQQFYHLNEFGDRSPEEYQQELECKKAYKGWCKTFDKKDQEDDTEKYEIFKANFLSHEDEDVELNKFADLTRDEFVNLLSSEVFVNEEYETWLNFYDKPNPNMKIWKGNYMLQLDEIKDSHCIQNFVFDEYFDLDQKSYEIELVSQFEYRRWCDNNEKEMSKNRYAIFKENYKISSAKNKVLNGDADLTQEEFTTMVTDPAYIEREFDSWLEFYGKSEGSFDVFKSNFLVQVKGLENTYYTDSFTFDQYSDLLEPPKDLKTQSDKEKDDTFYATYQLDGEDYATHLLEDLDMELLYKEEYDKWSAKFGKTKESKRYEIFKHNFLSLLEYNQRTSTCCLLNEYADNTAEEYLSHVTSEDHIRKEYLEWANAYDMPVEESRFNVFKEKFTDLLNWNLKSGIMHQLFESSDDSQDEFQPLLNEKYKSWAEKYGKSTSDTRCKIYKRHLIFQLQYNQKHQTCYSINQYGDLTQEEWEAHFSTASFSTEKNKSLQIGSFHRKPDKSGIPTQFYQEELPMNAFVDNSNVPFFVSKPDEEAEQNSFAFSPDFPLD